MSGNQTYLVETLTRDMIMRLMEEKSLSMQEAMDKVYRSKTYAALCDVNTGLFFQSSVYLYDELEHELSESVTKGINV